MLRKHLASSHRGILHVGVFGMVALTSAFITTDRAEARRYYNHRHVHHVHHDSDDDYSPQFSSIIVDGNSGATLTSTNPDGLRHPASLTKVMTLYLLFERLDSGKITLDTEMPVSQHAADQDPTKLDLRAGQTLRVEDAIKGMVTRSANDAAVVVGEFLGGSEDDFAKMMTRKAHALGMSRTVYRNASGLPNDEQVTTARDQSTLGRAIQDRFPRYYRYFSTTAFNFRGHTITGHNHLLGSVEGVDGIKTGYTRSSGFNLITSIHRGNRFLVGVVMGGRSGGSRDAIMRNLLAENLDKAATKRTVAAISERNGADQAPTQAAEAEVPQRALIAQSDSASNEPPSMTAPPPPARMSPTAKLAAAMAEATAAVPPAPPAPKVVDPAPLTSGVIQIQGTIGNIPGSSEPMKPVRVKTVQVKAGGPMKLASAGPSQPGAPITNSAPQAREARAEMPETSSAIVATAEASKVAQPQVPQSQVPQMQAQPAPPAPVAPIARAEQTRPETARADLPPQPPGFGTGNGVLGVLPASSVPAAPVAAPAPAPAVQAPQTVAYAAPQPQTPPQPIQQDKPAVVHTGWIVQVGALESEGEALQRIEAAKSSARGLLSKADSFTEPVIAKDNRKLFRARFAGLDRDQAEAVCRTLRHTDIPCMTAHN
ncbi:MAG: D-alanyl-D-alanine carboxypeptidase [Acetobacteraceae bacterium]|nr:D-alanyl-D-alanine carboxypeptidase [Acetobacteraceae bacterium]